MINPNKLCPGCMNELTGESGICSKCGFDISQMNVNPRCLPPYTVLAGKYLIGKVIGEGGFGVTYLGWDLNLEMKVAVKEYFPTGLATRDTTHTSVPQLQVIQGNAKEYFDKGIKKYTEEAKLLSRFSKEEGIVSIKDYIYENGTAYIVMEYIDGETLKDEMSRMQHPYSEELVLKRIIPVLKVLESVHSVGIMHRDISPDNIMVEKNGNIRLIDFGSARVTTGDSNKSLTITLKHGYAPEEQYRTKGNQGPWTDVYSICATMYRMLTGEVPEDAMDRLHQDNLKPVCDYPIKCTKAVSDAIMKGLSVKAEDRYQTIQELRDAIEGKSKETDPVNADDKSLHKNPEKKKRNPWIIAAVIASAAVVIIAMIMMGGSRRNVNSVADEVTASESVQETPQPAVEATIEEQEPQEPEETGVVTYADLERKTLGNSLGNTAALGTVLEYGGGTYIGSAYGMVVLYPDDTYEVIIANGKICGLTQCDGKIYFTENDSKIGMYDTVTKEISYAKIIMGECKNIQIDNIVDQVLYYHWTDEQDEVQEFALDLQSNKTSDVQSIVVYGEKVIYSFDFENYKLFVNSYDGTYSDCFDDFAGVPVCETGTAVYYRDERDYKLKMIDFDTKEVKIIEDDVLSANTDGKTLYVVKLVSPSNGEELLCETSLYTLDGEYTGESFYIAAGTGVYFPLVTSNKLYCVDVTNLSSIYNANLDGSNLRLTVQPNLPSISNLTVHPNKNLFSHDNLAWGMTGQDVTNTLQVNLTPNTIWGNVSDVGGNVYQLYVWKETCCYYINETYGLGAVEKGYNLELWDNFQAYFSSIYGEPVKETHKGQDSLVWTAENNSKILFYKMGEDQLDLWYLRDGVVLP
ncbi:MAG: serine/threonine-protein kinase [bacterium]|nr:serine/threonine-protein kinase [bacterium]